MSTIVVQHSGSTFQKQKIPDKEIIIVDDDSSDGTRQIQAKIELP